MSLTVWECTACAAVVFPPRALCPRCGSSDWRRHDAVRGVVETATVHRDGAVATVRTDAGPIVVVRNTRAARPGDDVALDLVDGAPAAV